MGIPDHLIFLLRNLYTGQEATVRTRHGTTDWFQIGKGVHQGCILSPCLFNVYAENIMRNAGLDEAQAGIKIAERNVNNLRYADNIILISSVQFSHSVVSDSLRPHERSGIPDLPVRHQRLESTLQRVHWVGDAIQPSHPLSSPSPAAFSLS